MGITDKYWLTAIVPEKGSDFKAELKGNIDVNGAQCKHINLYPNESSEKTYHTIELFVKGQTTYEIVKMLVKGREGNNTEYNIKSFKTGVTIPDGTFQFNEVVTGSPTGATGRVKSWDGSTNTLNLGATSGTFGRGDTVVGSASSASYKLSSIKSEDVTDKYDKGDEIEIEADTLLDFTETNPFGTY